MTTYWRNGFWRTSVLGNEHWVDGHEVDREEWEHGLPPQRNETLLRQARAHVGETARVVQPNAECPVCRSPVFFYQNEYGSRVFFDELGPPWPKHPCTVTQPPVLNDAKELITPSSASLRSQDEFDSIQRWLGLEHDGTFENLYGTSRWDVAIFITCYSTGEDTVAVISTASGYRYFLLIRTQKLSLAPGQLVTYFRNWLSYISPIDLQIVEIKLRQVGAKRILHHILQIEKISNADEPSSSDLAT